MKIAIASGKGGTGKTTVATNLALFLSRSGRNMCYADCDVDAADLHLILSPSVRKEEVFGGMPKFAVNQGRCIQCGKCLPLCRFGAITATQSGDGVTENMSGFVCPKCGHETQIFKSGGGERMAREMGVPFLGRIPIDAKVVDASDAGESYLGAYPDSPAASAFNRAIQPILNMERASEDAGQVSG